MTTSWYYESRKAGSFPQQQKLCEALRWTKYNLEGQKLESPNVLSAIRGNALTIRLLALDEALEHFSNAKMIGNKVKEHYAKNKDCGIGGTLFAENSRLDTKGAPIEFIEIGKERFEFKHIDVNLALYEFFTNFVSILDRLSYEVDKVYGLNIPKHLLDWVKLTSDVGIAKVRKKDGVLADLLGKYRYSFYTATRYRNRLAHDGIIDFEVERPEPIIHLRENPDDDKSNFNVDAILYCEDKRKDVLTLVNESYKLMLQYYRTTQEVS
jgi:hypothetical protein